MSDGRLSVEDLRLRREPKKIGAILCELGLLTRDQISTVLETMANEHDLLFGQTAVRMHLLGRDDVDRALSIQFGYDYIGGGPDEIAQGLESACNPFGAQASEIRAVRNFLMRHWFSKERKCLAVVGINAGDGVSTMAANLAISFAQANMETLLIDGDLRTGRQRQFFNVKERQGLSDMLVASQRYERIHRVTQFRNLSVLSSGTVPPNPLELVSQPAYPALCEGLGRRYDVVLIDAPSFSVGPDALETAAAAGGVLLVIRKNTTTAKGLQAFKHRLGEQGTRIVGYVVNDV